MELSILVAIACDLQSVRGWYICVAGVVDDQRTRLVWRDGRVLAQQRHAPLVDLLVVHAASDRNPCSPCAKTPSLPPGQAKRGACLERS